MYIYGVSKKRPTLACYNSDTCERILIFFCRKDEMLSIKLAIKRHFTVPHQLTYASALPGETEKHENCIFPQCCISALPEFNQLLTFFNLLDSRLILMLLYDSLSLVINAFSPQDCWWYSSGERKSIAVQELNCVASTMFQCAVFWVSYFAR